MTLIPMGYHRTLIIIIDNLSKFILIFDWLIGTSSDSFFQVLAIWSDKKRMVLNVHS